MGNKAAVTLFATAEYWALTPAQRAEICNGCGPKRLGGFIIPDTIWGLRITAACDIHDFMYVTGETLEGKKAADRVFLNNMIRLIDTGTRLMWLKKPRLIRAYVYYLFVKNFGGPFFWAHKNNHDELGEVGT